jgi:DNA-binding CsgD family transcriptional regulator
MIKRDLPRVIFAIFPVTTAMLSTVRLVGGDEMKTYTRKSSSEANTQAYKHSLINKVYEAVWDRELWPDVLANLARLLGGEKALLICHELVEGSGRIRYAHNVTPTYLRTNIQGLGLENSWFKQFNCTPQRATVYASEAIAWRTKLKGTRFYKDFVKPLGIEHTLHAEISRSDTEQLLLIVGRSEAEGPFSPQDIDLCQTIVVHMRRAWRIQIDRARHHLIEQCTLEALNSLSVGVVMVDARGMVFITNQSAQGIFERGDGLRISRRRMRAEKNSENAKLQELIANDAGARHDATPAAMSVLAVTRPSGRRAYSVTVCSFGEDANALDQDHSVKLVFIVDPEQATPKLTNEVLQHVHNLTPAEARIATMAAQGQRVSDIAQRLDISVHTARTHLKHIFDKTGVKRQAELVHVLHGSFWIVSDHH